MVRLTDRPAMTIAVDLGRKATKQTKNQVLSDILSISLHIALSSICFYRSLWTGKTVAAHFFIANNANTGCV